MKIVQENAMECAFVVALRQCREIHGNAIRLLHGHRILYVMNDTLRKQKNELPFDTMAQLSTAVFAFVCMYACMYVCMYVYIYMRVQTSA
jgi:hypothetical protein